MRKLISGENNEDTGAQSLYRSIDPEVAKFLMQSGYEEQRSSTGRELKELVLPIALAVAGAYGGYKGFKYLQQAGSQIAPEIAGKLPKNITPKMLKELRKMDKPTLKEMARTGRVEADRDLLYQLSNRVQDIWR